MKEVPVFLDPRLFEREWFYELKPPEKLAFIYILMACDQVGVWHVNKGLAESMVGSRINWEELAEKSHGNFEPLEGGKVWIPDYCKFQYGNLTPTCPPHRKYIKMLQEYGLFERVTKGYRKGLPTLPKGLLKGSVRAQEEEEEEEEDSYIPEDSKENSENSNEGLEEVDGETGGGGETASGGEGPSGVEAEGSVLRPGALRKGRKDAGAQETNGHAGANGKGKVWLDFQDGKWHGISDEMVSSWEKDFPAVDIEQKLIDLSWWCRTNGARGHKSNWMRFLVNNFTREQDKGRGR